MKKKLVLCVYQFLKSSNQNLIPEIIHTIFQNQMWKIKILDAKFFLAHIQSEPEVKLFLMFPDSNLPNRHCFKSRKSVLDQNCLK